MGVQADLHIYPYMREAQNVNIPFTSLSLPVHIGDVRLVVPLQDNVTGKITDTVVQHVRAGEPFTKPRHGVQTPEHTRYIAGAHNIAIPWPEAADPSFQPGPTDTPASEVEAQTFSPSLSHRPHPESILDELRNKYARTRSQHSPEYIQEKMRENAKEQWQRRREMLLPRQASEQRKVEDRHSRPKKMITEETVDLIRAMQKTNVGKTGALA